MLNPIELKHIGMDKLLCWNLLAMFHNIVGEITCEKLMDCDIDDNNNNKEFI